MSGQHAPSVVCAKRRKKKGLDCETCNFWDKSHQTRMEQSNSPTVPTVSKHYRKNNLVILHTVIIEDIQELSENRSSIWNGFGRAEKSISNRR